VLARAMSFWTYMLHCNGGYFYLGHTDDPDCRIAEHQAGAFPGFTRDHLPMKLVWADGFPSRYEAQEAEKKLAVIRGNWGEISRLACKQEKGRPSTSSGRAGFLDE
jgi:predicted GIY-YIG superfamily endonuclease